jgi:hypothetical protein
MYLRRIGLGDDISELLALAQNDPTVRVAVEQIKQQVASEGGSASDQAREVDARLHTLAQSYYSLVSNEIGVDSATALSAASKYVHAAHSVAGAIENVEGLVQSVQSGAPPQQILQQFTGVLVGASVGAGVLSAGIGAAIIGATYVIGQFLNALKLWGSSDGVQVCPNVTCNPAPKYVVNCLCIYKDPVPDPTSQQWMHFPNPNDPDDAFWFNGGFVSQKWRDWGMFCMSPGGTCPGGNLTIDGLFPTYRWFHCEQQLGGPAGDFQKMFWGAWKANQELLINGLKPMDDWKVLLNVLKLWNRAHESKNNIQFSATDPNAVPWPTPPYFNGDCPSSAPPPYFTTLISRINANSAADAPGNTITINGGPKKQPSRIIHLPPGAFGGLNPATNVAAPMSTSSKVIIGTTVAAGIGAFALAAYAHWHGMTFTQGAKHLWSGVTSKFHRTPRLRSRYR